MDHISLALKSVNLVFKAIENVHNYQSISGGVKESLARSSQSSKNLTMWITAFQISDYAAVPKEFVTNFLTTTDLMRLALDLHRRELENWVDQMGLPKLELEVSAEKESPLPTRSSTPHVTKKFSASKLRDFVPAPVYKSLFLFIGKETIRSLEEKLRFWESEVMNVYLTIATFAKAGAQRSRIPSSNDPSTAEFLSAARSRRDEMVAVNEISEKEWMHLYSRVEGVVDKNMSRGRQIRICSIRQRKLGAVESETKLFGDYICYSRSSDADKDESMNLARLFAVGEEDTNSSQPVGCRGDGDMLRCSAVVKSKSLLQYVFKKPAGSGRVRTLRTLLLDEQARPVGNAVPFHSVADRVKLCIRLAMAVRVVHSLGVVHKRINPETILVIDIEGGVEFPRTLGYPYLVGFHLSRSEAARERTSYVQDFNELATRGIYIHPREQKSERVDPYFMISDIYSLGVCLLEIALWRSLYVANGEGKDYVLDATQEFEALTVSHDIELSGGAAEKAAIGRVTELIRIAKAEIPRVLGNTFADAVAACLCAGDPNSAIGDANSMAGEDAHLNHADAVNAVSVKYLEIILKKLHAVYDGLSGKYW